MEKKWNLLKISPSDLIFYLLFTLLISNLLFDSVNKQIEYSLRPLLFSSSKEVIKEEKSVNSKDITLSSKGVIDLFTDKVGPRKGVRINSYIITSPFGRRVSPITGASSNHLGVDINTPIGTPIYVPKTPNVKWSFSFSNSVLGGLTCRISTKVEDAVITIGVTHASKCFNKGELIGLSGNTGTATTGPHAHISITIKRGSNNRIFVPPSKELLERLLR
jgi:murein DD-endopeptidase MepM/ murein hydrolase activator NlpD